jgi:hypothetical protein|tara:strand:+ start:417 stop:926 length:510 start_codon:yes stop_codon:yes gene_type:complete
MPQPDHLNDIERKLIDQLRTGTYITASGPANAWSDTDVTVYGQFPETAQVTYPAIIVEHIANGLETQFMGQDMGSAIKGEIYGIGFNIFIGVDKDSSITVDGEVYKERRLLNYLMLNCANVLMDTDFSSITTTQVLERHYAGFREIAYIPELEIWTARTNMIVTFKNQR